MKRNSEAGITKVSIDLLPLLEQLIQNPILDLTGVPMGHRNKLGRIAKTTGIIAYEPRIRRRKQFKIIGKNPKTVTIQEQ